MAKKGVADLVAKLSLDATQFLQATKRVDQNLNQMTRTLNAAKRAVGALAGVVGAAKLAGLANSALQAADAIGKVATQTGLATETVQVFRQAAEEAGFGASKAEAALERFGRRIGLAGDGAGPAAKMVKKLGIEVRDTSGAMRDTDAILSDVVDAISKLESETERTAATTAFFGEDARRLQTVLAGGTAGLRDFAEEMRAAGLIMDQSMIRNAEKANDEISRLSLGLSVSFANALGAALPELTEFVRWLQEGAAAFAAWRNPSAVTSQIRAIDEELEDVARRRRNVQRNLIAVGLEGTLSRETALTRLEAERVALLARRAALTEQIAKAPAGQTASTPAAAPEGIFGAGLARTMELQLQHEKNAQKAIAASREAAAAKDAEREAARQARAAEMEKRAAARRIEAQQIEAEMLAEARQREFESVVDGLKTEEERIAESYERRRQIILDNTAETGQQRAELMARLNEEEAEREKARKTAMLDGTKEFLSATSTLLAQSGQESTALYKAVAVTEATIAGILAVQKALASAPPPVNFAIAGMTAAITAANVAKISGIAHGGLENVPAESTYLLQRGERVLSPEQNRDLTSALRGGGMGSTTVINIAPAENNAQARYTAQQVAGQMALQQRRSNGRNRHVS